jgi:hypothetical protein
MEPNIDIFNIILSYLDTRSQLNVRSSCKKCCKLKKIDLWNIISHKITMKQLQTFEFNKLNIKNNMNVIDINSFTETVQESP